MNSLPWPFGDFDSNDTRTHEPEPRVYAQARCPCCDGRGWVFETSEATRTHDDD